MSLVDFLRYVLIPAIACGLAAAVIVLIFANLDLLAAELWLLARRLRRGWRRRTPGRHAEDRIVRVGRKHDPRKVHNLEGTQPMLPPGVRRAA